MSRLSVEDVHCLPCSAHLHRSRSNPEISAFLFPIDWRNSNNIRQSGHALCIFRREYAKSIHDATAVHRTWWLLALMLLLLLLLLGLRHSHRTIENLRLLRATLLYSMNKTKSNKKKTTPHERVTYCCNKSHHRQKSMRPFRTDGNI